MVNAVIGAPTRIDVVVNNQDGRLTTNSPIHLRNAVAGTLVDLAQIQNVVEINKTDNATLVWNASTQRYEVKILPGTPGADIDGGTF